MPILPRNLSIPRVIGESDARFPTDPAAVAGVERAQAELRSLNASLTADALPPVTSEELASGKLRFTKAKNGGTTPGVHGKVTVQVSKKDGAKEKVDVKVMVKPRFRFDQNGDVRYAFVSGVRAAAGDAAPQVGIRRDAVGRADGSPVIYDYVRPRVSSEEALSSDPTQWSAATRLSVLQDLVPSILFQSPDMGPRQYEPVKLANGETSAICLDWDHIDITTKKQLGVEKKLDRYYSMGHFATAQNLLLRDYVHGKLPLDLNVLRAVVRRYQQEITPESVAAAAKPFIEREDPDASAAEQDAKAQELSQSFMGRLGRLESVVERFIQLVEDEKVRRARGELTAREKLHYGINDALLTATGRFGASETMNETFNKSMRRLMGEMPVPLYHPTDSSEQVGTVRANQLERRLLERDAETKPKGNS